MPDVLDPNIQLEDEEPTTPNKIVYNGSSKVIKRLCELINNGSNITVDDQFIIDSANPVENSIVTSAIFDEYYQIKNVCSEYGCLKIKTVDRLPLIPEMSEESNTFAIVTRPNSYTAISLWLDNAKPVKMNNSVSLVADDYSSITGISYIGSIDPEAEYDYDTIYVLGQYSFPESYITDLPYANYRFIIFKEIEGQRVSSEIGYWYKEFSAYDTQEYAVDYITDIVENCGVTVGTTTTPYGYHDEWFPEDSTLYFVPRNQSESEELNNYNKYLMVVDDGEIRWEMIGGNTITVDSELSTSSTNPVQNKIITRKFNQYYDKNTINSMLENLPGMRYLIVDTLPVILEYDASLYFMMGMDSGDEKGYKTAIIMPSYDESEIYYELGDPFALPSSIDISDYTAFEYVSEFPEPGSQDETKIFTIAYTEFDREGNPTGNYIVEMDIFYTADGRQRIIEVGRTKGWTPTEPFVDLEDAQYYAQTFLPREITIRSVEGYPPAKEGVMYLIPNQESETGNLFDEYMVVRYYDSLENVWVKQYEKIGTMSADLANYYTKTETNALLNDKVDKVTGKGLSTEDYTTAEKTKLSGIETGAQVNIKPDWNATAGADNEILNKPLLATVATTGEYSDLQHTPTIPDELADLDDDPTHRLVTDTEKTTWNGKSVVSANPVSTTDTLTGIEIDGISYAIPTGTQGTVTSVNNITPDQNGNVTIDADDVGALPDDTPLFSGDYNDLTHKPTIPAAQVNADWNASGTVAEILNKPTIPAAQIQSDWDQNDSMALDYIKNKPIIPTVPVQSVNGQIGAVVLDANDVGALPDDTPLLEPLVGTTTNTTPTQVSTAIQAGRPVVVSYTDSTYGTFIFDSFAVSSGMLIGSQVACIHSGSTSTNMVVVLSADITNDTWEFHPPTILARRSDIPDELADLNDDATHRLVTDTEKSTWNGKSTVTANPASTTGTLTGIEIDGIGYAVSGGSTSLADAWRVKGGTALTASSENPLDLNTLVTAGTYYMNSDSQVEYVLNKPAAYTAIKRFTIIAQRVGDLSPCIKQIFFSGTDNRVFWRFTSNTGSAWTAWEEMAFADKMWRLAGGTKLNPTSETHVDLNTIVSAGTYFITSDIADRVDNKPTDSTNRFTLIVQAIGDADENRIKQIYMPRGTRAEYIRYRDGSTANWSSWKEIAFTDAIPAAQVNSDWNASSGVAEILNKPILATVATSGSYTDLINLPTVSTGSVGSASKGTNIAADDITAWSAGSLPALTVSSVACDDITAWSAGSVPSASVSNGRLTLSAGSAPSLSYTARSVGSASGWSAGTLPSLTYTARSIPNISVASVNVVTSIT